MAESWKEEKKMIRKRLKKKREKTGEETKLSSLALAEEIEKEDGQTK